MDKNKKIEQKVEETMQALDGMERAKTDDFFYSRLTAKLENRDDVELRPEMGWSFGFTFAVAVVLLIMSVNLLSIAQLQQEYTVEEETGRQEFIEEMATEYAVLDLDYYQEMESEE